MWSNNTRDMADILLAQNSTMSAFLMIIQGLPTLNVFNASKIAGLYDAMLKAERRHGGVQNGYYEFAKEFVRVAHATSRQYQSEIDQQRARLVDIREELLARREHDQRQDALIESLRIDELREVVSDLRTQLQEMQERIAAIANSAIPQEHRVRRLRRWVVVVPVIYGALIAAAVALRGASL
jgi:hypothetical protein